MLIGTVGRDAIAHPRALLELIQKRFPSIESINGYLGRQRRSIAERKPGIGADTDVRLLEYLGRGGQRLGDFRRCLALEVGEMRVVGVPRNAA